MTQNLGPLAKTAYKKIPIFGLCLYLFEQRRWIKYDEYSYHTDIFGVSLFPIVIFRYGNRSIVIKPY